MNEVMAGSMARRRLATGLLAAFAATALTLAVVGVYGLTAYAVAERTRELGIRMALGAQPSRVVGAVVGSSLSLAMLGVLAGVAAAAVAARFISSMLFEIRPTDPATFGAIVVLLLAAAFAASYLPARRTTRIDPARTLREQ